MIIARISFTSKLVAGVSVLESGYQTQNIPVYVTVALIG